MTAANASAAGGKGCKKKNAMISVEGFLLDHSFKSMQLAFPREDIMVHYPAFLQKTAHGNQTNGHQSPLLQIEQG